MPIHNNADHWALNNPGWQSVRGWLVLDYKTVVQFNPHSFVVDADGVRVDPTPEARTSWRFPFLQHEGTDEDFIRIVEGNWLISIHYDVLNDSQCKALAMNRSTKITLAEMRDSGVRGPQDLPAAVRSKKRIAIISA